MKKIFFLIISIITTQTILHSPVNGMSSITSTMIKEKHPSQEAVSMKLRLLEQVKNELEQFSHQESFDIVPSHFCQQTKRIIDELIDEAKSMYPAYLDFGHSYTHKELFGETIATILEWLGNHTEENILPTQKEIDHYRSFTAINELLQREVDFLEAVLNANRKRAY